MASRAVVVGSNAFPYLISYWFYLFTKYWQDEVDVVYFAISQAGHPKSWGYTKALLESHPKIKVVETGLAWPDSINKVTREVKEDLVLCLHDDVLIYKSGIIDKYFKIVEEKDVVVTPLTGIYTPSPLIQELMHVKFPNQVPFVSEDGDKEYSFYCHFFFIKNELLKKTSIDFGEWHIKIGEYCPLLKWTPLSTPFGADTNFKLCLELLNAGAKFYGIPKKEITNILALGNSLNDLERMIINREGIFSPESEWLHLQTMAYHIYGLYFDLGERESLEIRSGGRVREKIYNEETSFDIPSYKNALEIKIAWIYEFWRAGNFESLGKYHAHAQNEIEKIIEIVKLDKVKIKKLSKLFKNILNE